MRPSENTPLMVLIAVVLCIAAATIMANWHKAIVKQAIRETQGAQP